MTNENFTKAGRIFYAIGIAGIGIQQFLYADFRPVILPQLPSWIPLPAIWAYLGGAGLVIAGAFILFSKRAKTMALILGGLLLLFFACFHVTNQVFFSPYSFHLGLWTDPLKETALSGGAFLIAGSYHDEKLHGEKSSVIRFLEMLIPIGRILFSITMIAFGIDHFLYPEFVATLVPAWIPAHLFWTYFAGIALIGSGVGIMFKIRLRLISFLLGVMLFIWLIILHMPRAVADPYTAKGNEVTSVFEALAFSGIAFIIAYAPQHKNKKAISPAAVF